MTSVVVYTYYQSPSSDYNLLFFINNELSYKENIDYYIVINGYNCKYNFPVLDNLTILRRDNVGFDFGGHNYALNYMKKEYDYYFFMNSGVIGPILPVYVKSHWTSIFINKLTDKIKLVGTTIVCLPSHDAGGYGPKVEGFFFITDKIGLMLLQNEKTIFCDHPDKYSAIVNGEYGLSNCMMKHGYSIDCMLPLYQGVDWTNKQNWNKNDNKHPSRAKSYYGTSVNPFDVIFHKWYWANNDTVNYNIISEYNTISCAMQPKMQ